MTGAGADESVEEPDTPRGPTTAVSVLKPAAMLARTVCSAVWTRRGWLVWVLGALAVAVLVPRATEPAAIAGLAVAAVFMMTLRQCSLLALRERGWSRWYFSDWLVDHPTAAVALGLETLVTYEMLGEPAGLSSAIAVTIAIAIDRSIRHWRDMRSARAAVAAVIGDLIAPDHRAAEPDAAGRSGGA